MAETLFAATWGYGQAAVAAAWSAWSSPRHEGGDRRDRLNRAAVEGCVRVETDPTMPTVGIGGLPNRDGVVELDAGFMEGEHLSCGAVGALTVTCPAIEVAHRLAVRSRDGRARPIFLVGPGADAYALQEGFPHHDTLLTDAKRIAYEAWLNDVRLGVADVHQMLGHDTIGVIGWHRGHLAAAVATSGLAFKPPGRVGDSPLVGAGLYADNSAGAAVCTGVGEEMIRHAIASRVVERMRVGASASRACEAVLQEAIQRSPELLDISVSLIAVRADGDHGAATTPATDPPFEYHLVVDGEARCVVPETIDVHHR